METQKTFVAGKLTAGYLNGLIAFNACTDSIFELVSGEYGEDSEITKDFLNAAEQMKEKIFELMSYSIGNSLSMKDSYRGDNVEI